MTKNNLLTISVMGLIILNLISLGLHFYDKPPRPINSGAQQPPNEGPRAIIIERLHFDSAQIKEYDRLIVAHKQGIKGNDSLLRDLRTRFYQTLVNNDSTEKETIEAQITVVQRAIENIHYAHLMAVKQLCKPDQIAPFIEITKEFASFFSSDKRRRPDNAEGRRQPPPPGDEERRGPPPGDGEGRMPPRDGEERMPPPPPEDSNNGNNPPPTNDNK